jgi:hypothetical protein
LGGCSMLKGQILIWSIQHFSLIASTLLLRCVQSSTSHFSFGQTFVGCIPGRFRFHWSRCGGRAAWAATQAATDEVILIQVVSAFPGCSRLLHLCAGVGMADGTSACSCRFLMWPGYTWWPGLDGSSEQQGQVFVKDPKVERPKSGSTSQLKIQEMVFLSQACPVC